MFLLVFWLCVVVVLTDPVHCWFSIQFNHKMNEQKQQPPSPGTNVERERTKAFNIWDFRKFLELPSHLV